MSLLQSIGESLEPITDKLAEWDEWIQEKTDGRLTLPMVAGLLALLLIFIFAVWLIATAPAGFSLEITDESGHMVDGALVRLFDENGNLVATARTVNGTARFVGIPNKKYSFTVTKDGFETARGKYDPANPASNKILLKRALIQGGSDVLSEYGPPPGPPVDFSDVDASPVPDVGATTPVDNTPPPVSMTVVVTDRSTSTPVLGAIVTIRDASTNAFIVQGVTNAQGRLSANVRPGSILVVQARALGYAPAQYDSVRISDRGSTVPISLNSLSSSNAVFTNVTVLNESRQLVAGARVQIFSSPPLVDELTPADGRISVVLDSGRLFTVLASKPLYRDKSASISAGQSLELVLEAFPEGTVFTSLTISSLRADGMPAARALIGVFKKVGDSFVTFVNPTANDQGVSFVDGLEPRTTLRVNVTSSSGLVHATSDVLLNETPNHLEVLLPPEPVASSTPTPSVSPAPSTCPDGSTCPQGAQCTQTGSSGAYSCTSAASPTPAPTTYELHRVCLSQAQGPTSFETGGYTYALTDINRDGAAFEVSRAGSMTCARYSPDCVYQLGASSAANDALARITSVNVTLLSIDSRRRCVEVSTISICTSGRCVQNTQACPATRDLVCGSNGVSYVNSCEASRAGVASVTGVCSTDCTNQYDPVCAQSGITYTNACQAHRDGAQYVSGACQMPTNAVVVDVPAGWSLVSPPSSGRFLATDCTYLNRYVFTGMTPQDRSYYSVRPAFGASRDMVFGTGYWVYSTDACRIYWEQAMPAPDYRAALTAGQYHLVGAPSTAMRVRDVLGDCTAVSFFAAQGGQSQDPNPRPLSLDQTLEVGRGYWAIYDGPAGASCTLFELALRDCQIVQDTQFSGTMAQALCPAGKIAVGGGSSCDEPASHYLHHSTPAENGYFADCFGVNGDDLQAHAFAVCCSLNQNVASIRVVSSSPGILGARAQCADDEIVTGGGGRCENGAVAYLHQLEPSGNGYNADCYTKNSGDNAATAMAVCFKGPLSTRVVEEAYSTYSQSECSAGEAITGAGALCEDGSKAFVDEMRLVSNGVAADCFVHSSGQNQNSKSFAICARPSLTSTTSSSTRYSTRVTLPTQVPPTASEPDKTLYRCFSKVDGSLMGGFVSDSFDAACAAWLQGQEWRRTLLEAKPFGKIYSTQQPDTAPIYVCEYPSLSSEQKTYVNSLVSSCGLASRGLNRGAGTSRLLGFVRNAEAAGFIQMYGCFVDFQYADDPQYTGKALSRLKEDSNCPSADELFGVYHPGLPTSAVGYMKLA